MVSNEELKAKIAKALPEANIRVDGDGYHYEAHIISSEFAGLNTMKRHRLIYQALGSIVGNEVHALSLKTQTPEEAGV